MNPASISTPLSATPLSAQSPSNNPFLANLTPNEQALQTKFRNIDIQIIKYILNSVSFGNLQIAQETLAGLGAKQIQQIKNQLQGKQEDLTPEQQQLIMQFKGVACCRYGIF